MTQFALSKSSALSRSALPSTVQPGVEALGYHQISTQWPRKSARDTGVPDWSGRVKSGAGVPGVSISAAKLNPKRIDLDPHAARRPGQLPEGVAQRGRVGGADQPLTFAGGNHLDRAGVDRSEIVLRGLAGNGR